MKYSLRIAPEEHLINELWEGGLSYQEMIEAWKQQLLPHPEYRTGMNVLADYRNAQSNMTGDDVRRLSSWVINHIEVRYLAIVVDRTVDYGMARMFQIQTAGDDSHYENSMV